MRRFTAARTKLYESANDMHPNHLTDAVKYIKKALRKRKSPSYADEDSGRERGYAMKAAFSSMLSNMSMYMYMMPFNKPTTISILVSRSQNLRDIHANIKAYLKDLRKNKSKVAVSLVLFGSRRETIYRWNCIDNAPNIPSNTTHSHNTALYDTICHEITRIKNFRKQHPQYKQSTMIVYADGSDNASANYRHRDAKKKIKTIQRDMNCNFNFPCYNEWSLANAPNLGIMNTETFRNMKHPKPMPEYHYVQI